MKRFLLAATLAISLLWATACLAQVARSDAPIVYRGATEEARFRALATSLRCVMCQNQSLADSDALIAHDLRRQILAMMREGKSDPQIRAFLVARYGEFVLYKPRVEPATWLLWFGPFALLLAGGTTIFAIVRKRTAHLRTQSAGTTAPPEAAPESSEDW
jgi:cytochrome c-type biogenesis protein CcmH